MSGPVSLLELVPARYRLAGERRNRALEALFQVLQGPFDRIHAETWSLYRNWFVETCELRAVPLVGSVIGADRELGVGPLYPSLRSYVGQLSAYRKRRGVLLTFEQAARDLSGWGIDARLALPQLSITSSLRDPRPRRGRLQELRDLPATALIGGPFDPSTRTVDLRVPTDELQAERRPHRPVFRPDVLTVRVWRLRAFDIEDATPAFLGAGRYTFDPRGLDCPLFARQETPAPAREPGGSPPVARRLCARELRQRLALARRSEAPASPEDEPGFVIRVGGTALPTAALEVADLRDWAAGRAPEPTGGAGPRALVDPARGRFLLLDAQGEASSVDYSYGFSGGLGAAPVPRATAETPPGTVLFLVGPFPPAQQGVMPDPEEGRWVCRFASLEAALRALCDGSLGEACALPQVHEQAERGLRVVVRILDSRSHAPAVGAAFPLLELGALPDPRRIPLRQLVLEAASGARPCLRGDLACVAHGRASLELSGLLLDGRLRAGGDLRLTLRGCTQRATRTAGTPPPLPVARSARARRSPGRDPLLDVRIEGCAVGALRLSRERATLRLSDSIVDAAQRDPSGRAAPASEDGAAFTLGYAEPGSSQAIAGRGPPRGPEPPAAPPARLERATVFGATEVARLEACDVIFAGPVRVRESFRGFVERCYLPAGSAPPRATACVREGPWAEGRVEFVSRHPEHPGYAQLARDTPREVRQGGLRGFEMGAFQRLMQPLRAERLQRAIEGFLPPSLEAGVLYEA